MENMRKKQDSQTPTYKEITSWYAKYVSMELRRFTLINIEI